MTPAVRLSAALLLAGLMLINRPGDVWAENTVWKFKSKVDPITDEASGSVLSAHLKGGHIGFNCERGQPIEEFLAVVVTPRSQALAEAYIKVSWRIDSDTVRNENWEAERAYDANAEPGSSVIFGQKAYDFASAVARAQKRVVFRNPNETVVYDVKGSTKAISLLLELCGLGR